MALSINALLVAIRNALLTGTTISGTISGSGAAGAADSGNPVKTGGKYNSTPPTLTDTHRGDTQLDARGNTKVSVHSGASAILGAAASADGIVAATAIALAALDLGHDFNGTTWDRRRANRNDTILASAARTATHNTADLVNHNGRSLHLVIDTTAIAATPSVVFTIQGKDEVSGQYYTILASAAITSVSTVILRVGPGLTAAANLVANDVLPRTWRVLVTHGDADSITYSVGAAIIN